MTTNISWYYVHEMLRDGISGGRSMGASGRTSPGPTSATTSSREPTVAELTSAGLISSTPTSAERTLLGPTSAGLTSAGLTSLEPISLTRLSLRQSSALPA